ncbi:protein TIC 40 [Carex littledalei]|uniref:Protein TIC 40, chloroplastic n=1 Tax=Carex littledalei TaxID=544730 RepID=A0A833VW54_9POAL|nr:protein TIC 40 [Carex littledalei]
MEKLALTSSVGVNPTFAGAPILRRRSDCQPFFLPTFQRGRLATVRYKRFFVSAVNSNRTDIASSRDFSKSVFERFKFQGFASISSSSSDKRVLTGTVTAPPVPPPSSSYIGTPLFWVGIGVALSALFSVVVTKLKQYALQQAFKTMMNQSGAPQGSSPFANPAFPGGSPFPFPPMPPQGAPGPFQFSPPPAVQERREPAVTVDVSATKTETPPSSKSSDEKIEEKDEKKFAFVDVSPEEKEVVHPPEPEKDASRAFEPEVMGSTNGAAFKTTSTGSSDQSQSQYQSQSQPSGGAPFLSVDALEKMMEDPTVQQMVYPYLPEEMRNPTTFKWMLQNPQYRQQLQDMLNNMGGNSEWDSRMMDSLKNFDLSSPEVKQQFEQIGLTPEEVVNKIMSNPDVATAFQNPRVQAAIMDCSQNPLNISKYQNDKEVMDVFTKIADLFPGVTG